MFKIFIFISKIDSGNILCIIELLHHDYRLQTWVIVSFSDKQILFTMCNRLTFTPVLSLKHIAALFHQLSSVTDKSAAAAQQPPA